MLLFLRGNYCSYSLLISILELTSNPVEENAQLGDFTQANTAGGLSKQVEFADKFEFGFREDRHKEHSKVIPII
jgi:hypothetical protein